jgi:hypothetical protein
MNHDILCPEIPGEDMNCASSDDDHGQFHAEILDNHDWFDSYSSAPRCLD